MLKLAFSSVFLCILIGTSAIASPPARLYHFGPYTYLKKDIEAKTIPIDDWNQFIMGNKNNMFELATYRKGLYGAEKFWNASYYSNNAYERKQIPWAMIIEINPSCVPYSFDSNYDTPEFKQWANKNLSPKTINHCSEGTGANWYWKTGFGYNETDENECLAALAPYLDYKKVKIAADTAFTHSWYIRDHQCISNIRGTPDEMIDLLIKQAPSYSLESYEVGTNAPAMNIMLTFALAQSKQLTVKKIILLKNTFSVSMKRAITSSDWGKHAVLIRKEFNLFFQTLDEYKTAIENGTLPDAQAKTMEQFKGYSY